MSDICTNLSGADQDRPLHHDNNGGDNIDDVHQTVDDSACLDQLETLGFLCLVGVVLEGGNVSEDEEQDRGNTEEDV